MFRRLLPVLAWPLLAPVAPAAPAPRPNALFLSLIHT